MSAKLPYVPSPGLVEKVLGKIIDAKTPERFTSDFLGTKLGMTGGSANALIPLLKKIEFLNPDGTPTEIYRRFRTEGSRGAAMAEALKSGYAELFSRNEYAHELDRSKLADLVNEVTGAEKDSRPDQFIVSTFWNLKQFADFDLDLSGEDNSTEFVTDESVPVRAGGEERTVENQAGGRRLNLAYTINLNLPESTDPEVFNAIFRSLKENLLK